MYMSQDKPIGWWAQNLHRTLEDAWDRALAGEGVSRRQWQLLNVAARTGSVGELAPFLTDPGAARELVGGLVDRGWVRVDGDVLTLTPAGAAAHDTLTTVVQAQRARSMRGITTDEYATAVDVLRRMAENTAPDGPDRGWAAGA
ncbi:MAG TPA: MarR family transcriptional regulator [Pseudonocardia sp.]|nr:MarR family transcriptional regulator [Pseudonocardia sp.]